MTPAVIESMTAYATRDFRVRVWRAETEVKDLYANEDIHNFLFEAYDATSQKQLAESVLEFDRVTAAEVTDYHGNGVVLYKEWP